MFGFGRSSNEKAVISLIAPQFEAIGIPHHDAVVSATKLVDEVLSDLRPRGIDPYKCTQGDEYVTKEQFTSPRVADGLTIEDIRAHWNRPLLVIFCEIKMRSMINFIVIDVANQQGKDLLAAGAHYKKTFPRFGDPTKWDPNEKFNIGLREIDADLFPEFASRVDAWLNKTAESEVSRLIELHGTLNAVIRNAVSKCTL